MKKTLLVLLLSFSFVIYNSVKAQIICIYCYEQNDSISQNVTNMILNGGFENTNCLPNIYSSSFCPNSNYYSCSLPDWTCTGGGTATYVSIDDYTFTQVADGNNGVYLGNGSSAMACSTTFNDTSCLGVTNCEVLNIPTGYPTNDPTYGGTTGVSIEQTVSGLTPGATYVLEFWAGGEPQSHGWMDPGVFAVDVGFGKTYLRCKPTCPGCIGTRYLIEFNATSTSHTIRFTNWGHICIPCTEVILDNVRLYTLAELSPSVPPCAGVNPVALFNAVHHICPGTCTDFTNLSVNGISYQWTFVGATPSVSTDVNPTNVCYNSPGTYDVQLIATNGNGSDTLLLPNYITVYPYPAPQGISQSGDTLIANAGAVTYQWYHGGVLIPGATDYFYVATESGDYNVAASDANNCQVEAAIFDVVAAQFEVSGLRFEVYPNPVVDKCTIHNSQFAMGAAVKIAVYNILGVAVQSEIRNQESEMNVDVSSLPSGAYWLEVSSDGKIGRTTFVKQ